jgi:hypothetical protein
MDSGKYKCYRFNIRQTRTYLIIGKFILDNSNKINSMCICSYLTLCCDYNAFNDSCFKMIGSHTLRVQRTYKINESLLRYYAVSRSHNLSVFFI